MKNLLFFLLVFFFVQASAQERLTENVFIITYDGLRWQELFSGAVDSLITDKAYTHDTSYIKKLFWAETPEERREILFPFFWDVIAKEGQLYGNRWHGNYVNCTNQMWFSYPGYNEILTGAADDANINSNDKIANPNVTILEHLNQQAAFQGKVAAFGSWDVFPFIINEERSGVPVNAGFEPASGPRLTCREETLNKLQKQITGPWNSVRLDGFTHNYAMEYIQKNKPRVLYIAYGETDDFAHDGRYDFYLTSAKQTDGFIRELWEYAQSDDFYRGKTTFIITTDHGRGHYPKDTWQHHGIKINEADQIWFAILGPDTPPTGEIKTPGQLYQNQVAATVASLLGVNFKNGKEAGASVRTMVK